MIIPELLRVAAKEYAMINKELCDRDLNPDRLPLKDPVADLIEKIIRECNQSELSDVEVLTLCSDRMESLATIAQGLSDGFILEADKRRIGKDDKQG